MQKNYTVTTLPPSFIDQEMILNDEDRANRVKGVLRIQTGGLSQYYVSQITSDTKSNYSNANHVPTG